MPWIEAPAVYEPFVSPLFLPWRELTFRCEFDREVHVPVQEGGTPGTLLTGLWRGLLLARACEESPHRGAPAAALREVIGARDGLDFPCCEGDFGCLHPGTCVAGALHRLRCAWQPGRVLPPVVRLSAPLLWEDAPVRSWELVVSVLGRGPLRHLERVVELVRELGQVGLRVRGQVEGFSVEGPLAGPEATWIGAGRGGDDDRAVAAAGNRLWIPETSQRLLLAFATPLLLPPRTRSDDATGEVRRLFERRTGLDLSQLLGNLAFDLCALDLEDRPPETGARVANRRALCEAARVFVAEAAGELTVLSAQLGGVDLGRRASRSGAGTFSLQGVTGFVVVRCPGPLVPWVRAMSHWRAGQLGSKGFGEVQVWG